MKPRKITAKLLEVGKDFDVKLRSYRYSPKYKVVRKLVMPKGKIRTTAKKILETYAELAKHYPKYIWAVERVMVFGRIFYRIERKKEGDRSIPIYYSTTLGRVFVPTTCVRKHYRLTCSVVSYRLRDLKVHYRLTNC
jgi:hypothetical protein